MRPRSNRDGSRLPEVELRSSNGALLRILTSEDADTLHHRCLAEWIGQGRGRYLRLTVEAPWHGGSQTTRPVRADQSCVRHLPGQLMGNSRLVREHSPLPGADRG